MQPSHHVPLGLALLGVTVTLLVVRYARMRKPYGFPFRGWAGFLIIVAAELLLALRSPWVSVFFTPIVWTGYLLLVDAMVESLEGSSRLSRAPREFISLACWSVPLWLIFEAYNLRLRNWAYGGLPDSLLLRDFGYVWSFATIWPAIFETADLVRALKPTNPTENRRPPAPRSISASARLTLMVLGAIFLAAPLLLPVRAGAYLFGAVWIGFALLLDPVNGRVGGRSLLGEIETGNTVTLVSLFAAGWICGILWEFWNYWAHAKWLYIFPILQNAKIFEMPAPGFLGFLPFAAECFVIYESLRVLKSLFLTHTALTATGASQRTRAAGKHWLLAPPGNLRPVPHHRKSDRFPEEDDLA